MMTDAQFDLWCERLKLSQSARALIEQIRTSAPSHRVQSRAGNVPVRYPSRKMSTTIQAESHKNELAGIYALENDEQVLEFYDQPPQITLHYEAKNGRRIGVKHTPDYFVIRKASPGWEEWKTEEELLRLAIEQPNRYLHSDDGSWHCPPGETIAAPLGFYYQINSVAQISWIYQRNLLFLEDYLRDSPLDVSAFAYQAVCSFVETHPGVTLRDLLEDVTGVTSDDIYTLIAHKQIFVDLSAAPLAEPERVHVFLEVGRAE